MILQRNASSWLQSSFEFDEFDGSCSKKKNTSQDGESENEKVESFPSFSTSFSFKKKSTSSLSTLLAACAPQKSSELAVSRQKQQEISRWFQGKVVYGKPSILVISGPSGCGKTEAFKVIAREHNFEVVEWITPMDQIMDENSKIFFTKYIMYISIYCNLFCTLILF